MRSKSKGNVTSINSAHTREEPAGTSEGLARQLAETNAALSASEELFRTTFDQAAIGLAHVARNGRFLRVNRKLCEITGYTHEELLARTFFDLVVAGDSNDADTTDQTMPGSTLPSYSAEKKCRRKNGESFWVNLVSALGRDAGGEPKYFISVFEDITARKTAEMLLQRLNRLYVVLSRVGESIVRLSDRQQLYEAVCHIAVEQGLLRLAYVAELDPSTGTARPVAASGATGDYLETLTIVTTDGPASEGTVGTVLRTGNYDVSNDLPNDPRSTPWHNAARQQQFGSTAAFPLKIGETTIGALVLAAAETHYFQEDEIRLMVAVANDVSFALEAIQKEKRRLVAEERYRELVETSQDLIWAVDAGASFTYINQAARKIYGREPEQMIGRPIFDFVPPEQAQQNNALLAEAIQTVRETLAYESRVVRSDGNVTILQSTARMTRDKQGRHTGFTGSSRDITESKRKEEALQQNEARLRMSSRLGRIGAWTMELPAVLQTWSDEVCAIHEIPPGSTPTVQEAIAFHAPEFRPAITAAIESCVRSGTPYDREVQIITAQGRRTWVRTIGEAERDASGTVLRIQGAFQDISDLKRALEEARQSSARLTSTLESITDAFYTTDLDWRFTYVNGEAERLLQRPRLELLGKALWEEFKEAVGTRFHEEFHRAMRDKIMVQFEEYYPPFDQWFEVRAYPSAAGLTVYFQDISKSRAVREEVRISEERFRLLSMATNDAIWDWDMVANQVWWNDNFEVLFGYKRGDVDTHIESWNKRIHPEDRARVLQRFHAAIDQGKVSWSDEYRYRCKDGSYAAILDRSRIIRDAAGKPVRMIGGITDLTQRKGAENELARVNRALQMVSLANEAMIRAASEKPLLDEICRIAVETGGFHMAWVGYAQDDADQSITPQAHAGMDETYFTNLKLTWSEEVAAGRGPAGKVIRTGQPVVIPDVVLDEAFSPWQETARKQGYRGMVLLPLKNESRTFGFLGLFLTEVSHLPPDELRLLQDLADNLAFGIVNVRVRAERERTLEAVLAIAKGVSASAGDDFFEHLGEHVVKALGADAGFFALIDLVENTTARTVSNIVHGRRMENLSYELAGTPSEWVLSHGLCLVERDLQARFPTDSILAELGMQAYAGTPLLNSEGAAVGLLAVLFKHPIAQPEFIRSTIQIFAASAATELERQKAVARLREHASLLDKAQDAIMVLDLAHRITYWNKGAHRIYGWSNVEIVGRSSREMVFADKAVFDTVMQTVLKQGDWVGELAQAGKDGGIITVESSWTLVRNDDGQPQSVLVINTDVTARKKIEQQFLRAQRMESIGTLAGGIAHDLNNMLSPILMGIGLLKEFETGERSQKVINLIEQSAKRGTHLVKQVLSFSRGVEGAKVAVHLGHIIREVESIAENTFPKNISIETDIPKDLWLVMGDPTQIDQVLLNLCVNARDAMPDGGHISIRVQNDQLDEMYAVMDRNVPAGRYVLLEVADTGCGMPQEIIERIFEPFYTTKELGKGTGLGLSTVLGIVRSHGGIVNVTSKPGEGSLFKVHFPAQPTEVTSVAEFTPEVETLPSGSGELILVVDDDPSILDITTQTLEAFGYRVMTAKDGAQAVGLYAMHRDEIAVIITDMMMPVMDGPAMMAVVRQINPQVRLISASGMTAGSSGTKAPATGTGYVLAKPYTAETILTLLKRVLTEAPSSSTRDIKGRFDSRPPLMGNLS